MRYKTTSIVTLVLAALMISCTGATSSSSGTLIEYLRIGGIAGFDDHLVINTDGTATLSRKAQGYEFELNSNTTSQLETLFDEAKFLELDKEYLPSHQGGDLFEYVLMYQGHTVRTLDSAVPEALWPILETLNQIIENRK